jgi:hypothetical protein
MQDSDLFRSTKDRKRPDSGAGLTVGIPPPSRNQRVPTAGDTPATTADSSLDKPPAIAPQNRCRCSRRVTGGRPGDRIGARSARSARRRPLAPIATPHPRGVRRLLESTQYPSFAFGRRLTASGLVASMGTVGDALDNAVAESFFATLECAAQPLSLADTGGPADGDLRLHRGLLQPPTPPLDPRLPPTRHLRAAPRISSIRGLTTVSTERGNPKGSQEARTR